MSAAAHPSDMKLLHAGTVLAPCPGETPGTIETLSRSAMTTVALRLSASQWPHWYEKEKRVKAKQTHFVSHFPLDYGVSFAFVHQAALQVGGHGERLHQCREVVLTTYKTVPVQVITPQKSMGVCRLKG